MTLNLIQCHRDLRNARRDQPSLQTFQASPVAHLSRLSLARSRIARLCPKLCQPPLSHLESRSDPQGLGNTFDTTACPAWRLHRLWLGTQTPPSSPAFIEPLLVRAGSSGPNKALTDLSRRSFQSGRKPRAHVDRPGLVEQPNRSISNSRLQTRCSSLTAAPDTLYRGKGHPLVHANTRSSTLIHADTRYFAPPPGFHSSSETLSEAFVEPVLPSVPSCCGLLSIRVCSRTIR